MRISVSPVTPCRMISCPAAKGIRCVNPSRATRAPGLTYCATASRRVSSSATRADRNMSVATDLIVAKDALRRVCCVSVHSLPLVQRKFGETTRRDFWWIQPLAVFLALSTFIVYATWAAFQGEYYEFGPYLSPFYSP